MIPIFDGKTIFTPETKWKNAFVKFSENRIQGEAVELDTPFNEKMRYFFIGKKHYLQKSWEELTKVDGEIVLVNKSVENTFDEENNTFVESFSPESDPDLFRNNFAEVLSFSCAALQKNKWAYDTFMESNIKLDKFYYEGPNLSKNVYTLFVLNPTLLEQMLKTDPNMLFKAMFGDEPLDGKFKDVYQLPKSVVAIISKIGYSTLIPQISEIGKHCDGNDILTLAEFLQNTKKMHAKSTKAKLNAAGGFLNHFSKVIEQGLPLKPALEYIIRQTWAHFYFSWENITEVTMLLNDYTRMRKLCGYGDRWPQNIRKGHQIMHTNQSSCSNETKEQFVVAVNKYKHLERELTLKCGEYVVVVPSSVDDLLKEGNSLNHCVGSYAQLVAIGESRVLFLRKKSAPNESLVTFEIDKDNHVCHAKGVNNTDPEDNESQALRTWEAWAKKTV